MQEDVRHQMRAEQMRRVETGFMGLIVNPPGGAAGRFSAILPTREGARKFSAHSIPMEYDARSMGLPVIQGELTL